MSRWNGARNSYSSGSSRVTWTFSTARPGHAMDWRLTMSAGRRLGAWKEDSRGARTGARGAGKTMTRFKVPFAAAGSEIASSAALAGLPAEAIDAPGAARAVGSAIARM